jgi:hypothetical protein
MVDRMRAAANPDEILNLNTRDLLAATKIGFEDRDLTLLRGIEENQQLLAVN